MTSISAMALVMVLSACGGDAPPQVVRAPIKEPEPVKKTVTVKPVKPPEEKIEEQVVAKGEDEIDEESETQLTIKAIIERLSLENTSIDPSPEPEGAIGTALTSRTIPTISSEMSSVTWTLETSQDNVEPAPEAVIPEGKDPSLAADALAAAFALIRQSTDIDNDLIQSKTAPMVAINKPQGNIRVAMLVPLTGRAKTIGEDMRKGAELAIFTLGNANIDLTFHDTSEGVEKAMGDAISQEADLVIGPLFASNTIKAQPIAQMANLPILSFSNDSTARKDGVWLIGQTPEQEIETVLTYALTTVKPIVNSGREVLSVAIITQDSAYGARISQHAIKTLRREGQFYAEELTLSDAILNDEKSLRASIKSLTNWLPPASDGSSRIPDFDLVIIAGDAGFSLRVAPVLNWYDLDPEVVQYLGTSVWDNPATLQEPSLTGGWFAQLPSERLNSFSPIWDKAHQNRASKYAVLAFDMVALATTLDRSSQESITASMVDEKGFSGFSGAFRLNLDGSTTRPLEIKSIANNRGTVIVPPARNF